MAYRAASLRPCLRHLHGGVMRWAGDSPHCHTNRAGIWAFITSDKSVKGVWRRFSVRNITTALNHYMDPAGEPGPLPELRHAA